MPLTIKACRAMIDEQLFVNIYDFIAGNKIKFSNAKELASYIRKNEKYYPCANAKENIKYRCLLKLLN
jgi:hypothetical protein